VYCAMMCHCVMTFHPSPVDWLKSQHMIQATFFTYAYNSVMRTCVLYSLSPACFSFADIA
jgi:hypothetical protein